MQSRSSTPVFDLWGEVPAEDAHKSEHQTVAYAQPEFSELIAASVEVDAITDYESETSVDVAVEVPLAVESTLVLDSIGLQTLRDLPIESTVVIASSRSLPCSTPCSGVTSIGAVTLGQPRVRRHSTSTLAPFVVERVSSPSTYPVSMSVSLVDCPVEEPVPLPLGTRILYALSIAAIGVVCGIVGATSLLHVNAAGAPTVAVSHAMPRISVDDRIPVVANVREKAPSRSARSRVH